MLVKPEFRKKLTDKTSTKVSGLKRKERKFRAFIAHGELPDRQTARAREGWDVFQLAVVYNCTSWLTILYLPQSYLCQERLGRIILCTVSIFTARSAAAVHRPTPLLAWKFAEAPKNAGSTAFFFFLKPLFIVPFYITKVLMWVYCL